MIWNQNRIGVNAMLDEWLHSSKRILLNSPYRTDDMNYIDFDQRLQLLQMLSNEDRRRIAAPVFVVKMAKNSITTSRNTFVEQSLYQNRANIRSPPIFDISRSIPCDVAMTAANAFKDVISVSEFVVTTKTKMRTYLLHQWDLRQ